jgi:16S rRNA (guanine1207-N2)-methyltransferase
MFRQARDVLRPDGELWLIGNRHLAYHIALKKLFGKVELIASNAKFVVLRAGHATGP